MTSRFLADENVPAVLIVGLRAVGHDIVSVAETSPGSSDREVLASARREGRILLSFDKDFGELAHRSPSSPGFGVVLIRALKPATPDGAENLIASLTSDQPWIGHFSVVERSRTRMRPLPSAP